MLKPDPRPGKDFCQGPTLVFCPAITALYYRYMACAFVRFLRVDSWDGLSSLSLWLDWEPPRKHVNICLWRSFQRFNWALSMHVGGRVPCPGARDWVKREKEKDKSWVPAFFAPHLSYNVTDPRCSATLLPHRGLCSSQLWVTTDSSFLRFFFFFGGRGRRKLRRSLRWE